jgi:hypothetical protein
MLQFGQSGQLYRDGHQRTISMWRLLFDPIAVCALIAPVVWLENYARPVEHGVWCELLPCMRAHMRRTQVRRQADL